MNHGKIDGFLRFSLPTNPLIVGFPALIPPAIWRFHQDLALNEPQGSPEERQAWRRAQASSGHGD